MEKLAGIEGKDKEEVTQQRREKSGRIQKPRARRGPPPTLPIRRTLPYPCATFDMVFPLDLEKEKKFGPRLGRFTLRRSLALSRMDGLKSNLSVGDEAMKIEIETPAMICSAPHGMVKHLSRDNVTRAKGVEWIHVPLEDFLEHPVPVPAYHPSSLPLHGFLTRPPSSHILSLSLRDPLDNQNMPANTNAFIQVRTVRGVRKVGVDDWITWCKALRPDIIWAFVDAPKTLTGVHADGEGDPEGSEVRDIVPGEGRQTSQKRIMKSLDRSWLWVERLVRGLTRAEGASTSRDTSIPGEAMLENPPRPPIIVPLMGGCDPRARVEFARGLVDKLDSAITDGDGRPIKRIEDGVLGYAIELVDLPTNTLNTYPAPLPTTAAPNLDAEPKTDSNSIMEIVHSSLGPLSSKKLRIAHSPPSPHVILRLIAETGIDLFDVPWIAEAADLGIALDFRFPVPPAVVGQAQPMPIGHNLFEERFAVDFEPIGTLYTSWTCHPVFPANHLLHSTLDVEQWPPQSQEASLEADETRGFTRAYIHHLLHTHEMGAYALLHLHNLAEMDRFFRDIRIFISQNTGVEAESHFTTEIIRFYERYELPEQLFEEARRRWKEVEDARGKGSLKRDRDEMGPPHATEGGVLLDDAHPDMDASQSGAVAALGKKIEEST